MELSILCVRSALRIVIIVYAGVLILVSAITIGIIKNNEDINNIRFWRPLKFRSIEQLENLIDESLATAVWLIVFSIIVLFWEVLHAILPVISTHFSLLQRYSVVLMISDAAFSCAAGICSLASALASVVHANSWGDPPQACDHYARFYKGLDCDHEHLEGSNGAAAFLCFVQVLLFTVLGVLAVIGGFPKILVFLQRHGNGSRSEHEEQIHYDHEE